MNRRALILGAGISGLSLAFRLKQIAPDVEVILLEKAPRVGGTVWTERDSGFTVEIGPNGFLGSKPSTLELCHDLGIDGQLVAASSTAGKNRYLFLGDRLRRLPGGFGSFLRSDLLSWRGKLSLLWERFRGGSHPESDESIDAFARRRAGPEAADLFADALVTGIYAGDPKLLSLPACFPRLAEFERAHGSVLKGFAAAARARRREAKKSLGPKTRPGSMWSFPNGLRQLVETLASSFATPPIHGVATRSVQKAGELSRPIWTVHGEGKDQWLADVLILTCPAHEQARLLQDLDPTLAAEISAIPYNRLAVVALGFRREDVPISLDGFGFIAPQKLRRDVLGAQWCSSIFPCRAPEGAVLLRAMCGGQRPEMVYWDDDRLVAAIRNEFRLAMGIERPPIFVRVIRWPQAIPQYHVGHLQKIARIEAALTGHPGLFLGGNAYRGVALNDCTEQGAILTRQVSAYLQENVV